MKTLFDASARSEIVRRIRKVTPESQAAWGTMTVDRMVCHALDGLKIAFGEIETEFKPSFLSTRLGRWLVIASPMPWPRGKIKAARVFFETPPSGSLESDRNILIAYVERFSRGRDQRWGQSPFLGRLSADEWARLNHRHLDHHLTQFGC